MDSVILFLALFAGIGVLLFIEGFNLWAPFTGYIKFDISISVIEFIWVCVCIGMLISGLLTMPEILLATGYLAFHFIFGVILTKYFENAESIKDSIATLPEHIAKFEALLGLFFSGASIYLLFNHASLAPDRSFAGYFTDNLWSLIAISGVILIVYLGYRMFVSLGVSLINKQTIAAIEANEQCREVLGKIISATINEKVMSELETGEFAFNVVGEKQSALLIVNIDSTGADTETIVGGKIYLKNGEIIELEQKQYKA